MKINKKLTAKELYEQTRGLSSEEREQAIAAFAQEVGENTFVQELLSFADDTQQELARLSQDTIRYKTRWLNESWVNKSDICKRLYGTSDKSTVGYFTQQRQGKKPWKPGQLEKLDEIKRTLQKTLAT